MVVTIIIASPLKCSWKVTGHQSMKKYLDLSDVLWHPAGHFDQFHLGFDKYFSLIHGQHAQCCAKY